MNKEEIVIVAQLLSSMKDAINELDNARIKKDLARMNSAKKEILKLKEQIDQKL